MASNHEFLHGLVREAHRERQAAQEKLEKERQAAQEKLEKERQAVLDLTRQMADVRVVVLESKWQCKERTAELLELRGWLNVRGVLEHIESKHDKTKGRQNLWLHLLKTERALLKCLETASRRIGPDNVARFMEDMYASLSSHIYGVHDVGAYEKGKRRVVISGVEPRHREALVCICEHFSYPFEVIHESPDRQPDPSA